MFRNGPKFKPNPELDEWKRQHNWSRLSPDEIKLIQTKIKNLEDEHDRIECEINELRETLWMAQH